MARFRRRMRRAYRGARSSFRRSRRRSRAEGGSSFLSLITAGLYGAVRGDLANMAQPLTNQFKAVVPQLGEYTDEVLLGSGALVLGKFMPQFRKYTKTIADIEAYRIGATMRGSLGSSSTSSSGNLWDGGSSN